MKCFKDKGDLLNHFTKNKVFNIIFGNMLSYYKITALEYCE